MGSLKDEPESEFIFGKCSGQWRLKSEGVTVFLTAETEEEDMSYFRRFNGEPCYTKHKDCFRHRKKFIFCAAVIIMIMVYLCLCVSMYLPVRSTSFAEGECMLYYIVNTDGMKGLGHSIVMLVDENGCGTVFSFNGMQRSLGESLFGKSGVGKMSVGTMTVEETEAFLQTGNLDIDGDQLSDNYDMALYRSITEEEYDIIAERTIPYITAGEQFAVLYEKWAMEENPDRKEDYEQALEQMGQDKSLTLYQIYTNNCDHVARIIISPVDSAMQEYSQHGRRMTPNGNLKAFGGQAEDWGVMTLGEQSLPEKILMFLMIF